MWRGLRLLLQHVVLPVCQFKDRDWLSQVHLPAVFSSRGPLALPQRCQSIGCKVIACLPCSTTDFIILFAACGSLSHPLFDPDL